MKKTFNHRLNDSHNNITEICPRCQILTDTELLGVFLLFLFFVVLLCFVLFCFGLVTYL